MKKTWIPRIVAAMFFVAAGFAIPLFADDTDATIKLLTSGDWRFSGQHWSNVRTFFPNKTMVEHGHNPVVPIPWKISGKKIIIEFEDYEDVLLLPLDPNGTKGIDENGNEFTATLLVAPTPAPKDDKPQPAPTAGNGGGGGNSVSGTQGASPAPEAKDSPTLTPDPAAAGLQQKASDFVKAYHDSLVMIAGNGGNGSGFIANTGSATFLVTNAHVMAAIKEPVFKNMDGAVIPTGKAAAAVDADILRLEAQGGKPLEVMDDVQQNASIGDDVVVLGNAEGAGVVNTIMGKIVGVGASLIEVDAPFLPGNSGSPLIHLKTGKVVGIAAFVSVKTYDFATQEVLDRPVVRHFGYRLDNVKEWQPVLWQGFYAQAEGLGKIQGLTGDVQALYQDIAESGHVTPGMHTNPLIKDHVDEWLKDKGHGLNAEDALRADEMFVSFLKNASQADVNAAHQMLTYDYFQHKLAEVQRIRAQTAADLEKLILHK